jgi:hypothetical protein
MADEVYGQIVIRYAKNGIDEGKSYSNSVDATGDHLVKNVQDVTTTAAAISLAGVSTPKHLFARNLDATNYVEIGTGTGGSFVPFAKLEVDGLPMFVPLSTTAPTAKANLATCKVEFFIIEA